VKAMGKALDDAWAQLAPSVDNRPDRPTTGVI
jgi:hypothetical protein